MVNCFRISEISLSLSLFFFGGGGGAIVAIFDLVHDMDAMFPFPLTANSVRKYFLEYE